MAASLTVRTYILVALLATGHEMGVCEPYPQQWQQQQHPFWQLVATVFYPECLWATLYHVAKLAEGSVSLDSRKVATGHWLRIQCCCHCETGSDSFNIF